MDRIEEYAEAVVRHAISLQPGQPLFIRESSIHRDLALRIGEAGYSAGASEVRYHLIDQDQLAQLIRCGTPKHIEHYIKRDEAFHDEVIARRGAFVLLIEGGLPEPHIAQAFGENPRNRNFFLAERSRIGLSFQHQATLKRLVAGTVIPSPTRSWARRVFPELNHRQALTRLWEVILSFVLVDKETRQEQDRAKQAKIDYLDGLAIREMRIQGGGNDLRVVLSERARWQSSRLETIAGQVFHVNYPSDEIFTTPDARYTEGVLVASKPVRLWDNSVVENLVLEFKDGELISFSATEGEEAFRSWVEAPGGRRLGEIALVNPDSPIGQSGLFFHMPHLDENAASHIALGQGIAPCIAGSESMSRRELEACGFNHSPIHADIMFGSPEVSVVAPIGGAGHDQPLFQANKALTTIIPAVEKNDLPVSTEPWTSSAVVRGQKRGSS